MYYISNVLYFLNQIHPLTIINVINVVDSPTNCVMLKKLPTAYSVLIQWTFCTVFNVLFMRNSSKWQNQRKNGKM